MAPSQSPTPKWHPKADRWIDCSPLSDGRKCCLPPGQSATAHLLSKGEPIISQTSTSITHPTLLQESYLPVFLKTSPSLQTRIAQAGVFGLVHFLQHSHSPHETLHWTHGSFPTKQGFGSLRAQLKIKPSSTNAGSVKTSDKCSKASASNKHMNYSNCQELWLHDITSSSVLLLKSKHGYPTCRWAVPHNLLCLAICFLMDVHRLSQGKSFLLKEMCEACKQLLCKVLWKKRDRSEWFWTFGQFLYALKWDAFQSLSYCRKYNGLWLLVLNRGR